MTRLPLLHLLVMLSLGLATVGFGMARGQAPVAGQMVLCTGHGIVTVSVDAEGNPVESVTLCPDAALSALAALAIAAPAIEAPVLWRHQRAWADGGQWPAGRAVSEPTARGPPV